LMPHNADPNIIGPCAAITSKCVANVLLMCC
jgi:hypothetical protein